MEAGLLADILIGLAAGIVSGLLGVGGGIVLTPVLHYFVGLTWSEAVALSLLVIALQSPIGVWRHARRGAVSWALAIPLTLGGAVGVAVGHLLLPHLPVAGLKLAFAGLLLYGAWRFQHRVEVRDHQASFAVLLLVGIGAGLVARLLGVGGGIITVPLLGLMGTAVHLAVGTSLVTVFTNAGLATGANLALGLDWTRGIVLALGAIAGTVAGVRIAHALPELHLRRVVSAGMVLAAISIVWVLASASS